jgi:hypothetical protein
VNGVPTE